MGWKPKVDGVKRSEHPLYGVWADMRRRCNSPKCGAYDNYGGRGIKVCERWGEDFANFAADVGSRPEGHTLDRIDNDGNYEPSNVRWADRRTQNGNTRSVINSCGVPGVSVSQSGRYRARYKSSGEEVHLGTFDTIVEASNAIELYKSDKVKRSKTLGVGGVSKTGFKNVYYDPAKKYYYVQYTINKVRYCGNGTFETAEEAHEYVKKVRNNKRA